jgi:putative phosphoribosyl transferase
VSSPALFRDRDEAGRALAAGLAHLRGRDVVVLALPRGGLPVAAQVARALGAPLDVFVVRKLGVPGREELAMGAIASGGAIVLNRDVVAGLGLSERVIEQVVRRELAELRRREATYRADRRAREVAGRTVVLVDDGLATGSTMAAAAQALRERGVRRLVVAVPVGSPPACRALREFADEVVCLHAPEPFRAVGEWYRDFQQIGDEEVRRLLAGAAPPAERDAEAGG